MQFKRKFFYFCISAVCFLLMSGFTFASDTQSSRTIKTVVMTEPIPFETDYIDLPNQFVGYTKTVRSGTVGERRVEAQVICVGEKIAQIASISTTVTAKPINAVVQRGSRTIVTPTVKARWSQTFINPLPSGWVSADFFDYEGHNGVDLAAPKGTNVYASAGGTVTKAGWWGEYGYCIIIDHGQGIQTLYAHNSKLHVKQGQTVKQGERIAQVGSTGNSTGNHLHFEIRTPQGFLDPLLYLGKSR